MLCLSVVVSLRTWPLLITPRKESQAIDNVKSVLPRQGEGVSRSLREGCDRTVVLGAGRESGQEKRSRIVSVG